MSSTTPQRIAFEIVNSGSKKVLILQQISTWMFQEVSKWLVSGL